MKTKQRILFSDNNLLRQLTIFVFCLLIFKINFLHAQPALTPWSMYHHDPQHTGRSPYPGPEQPNLQWSYVVNSWIQSSVAVGHDGTIYFGSSDYNLYAVNSDGTFKWSFRTGSFIDSSPAIGVDGTIYIASIDDKLYAVHADGTLKWSFTTGDDITSSPVISSDGTIYIGSGDNNLYALKPDRTLKWIFSAGDKIHSSPAIGADAIDADGNILEGTGIIYVGSWDKNLYAIDPDNGQMKWDVPATLGDRIFASPSIGCDGTIYVGCDDGKLYAIHPDNGQIKWSFSTGGRIASCAAIARIWNEGTKTYQDATIYVGSFDHKLYAINLEDHTKKWDFPTGDVIWGSAPAIDKNGVIYVGSFDNNLYAIEPNGDPNPKWTFETNHDIFASPVIGDNGTIYIGSKDRTLYAIGKRPLPIDYPSVEDIIDKMNNVASAYPEIAKVIDLTTHYNKPATFEGRHLYAIKISDNVAEEEDEPDILIVSNHHAREISTPVIALHAIDQFTTKYPADKRIREAVENYEIWIAPTWNPDGYNYAINENPDWRKNRLVFETDHNGILGIGVDLNRNYPHLWNSGLGNWPGVEDITKDSSGTYIGPWGASEVETKTMIAFANDQVFEKLLDFHSYGRDVVFGYCGDDDSNGDPLHPFFGWLKTEAKKLSKECGFTKDPRGPSADGENYEWHLARFGSYAFLVETGTMFWTTYENAQKEADDVFSGILWDIEQPIPLSGHVTDRLTGAPLEANIELLDVEFKTRETNSSGGAFGQYHIFAPPDKYKIRFTASGYLPAKRTVHITNSPQILDIQLIPDLRAPTDFLAISGNDSSIDKMLLKGNYPNPFNSETVINYEIRESGDIQIDVYNLMGRHIKTLVNKQLDAGFYTIAWDGTNELGHVVASNTYLYRITQTTNDKTSIKFGKMVFIK